MASLALGRRAQRIVSGTTEWLVRIHDARNAQPLHVMHGHRKVVHAIACSPFHDLFASASDEGLLQIGRMSDGKWVRTLQQRGAQIWATHFSDRGRVLWTAAQDGVVRAYRIRDGRALAEIRVTASPLMALDIHGRRLAVGASDGTIYVLNIRTRKVVKELKGHNQTAYSVQFHPTGRWLATGSADWTVRVWDPTAGTVQQTIEFENGVSAVAWAPDGRLAVGCSGGGIHLFGAKPAPEPGPPKDK